LSHGEKLHGSTAPSGPGASHYRGFTITLRHTTLGRTPGQVISLTQRSLPDNTQCSEERLPCPVGIRSHNPNKQGATQTQALDCAATGIWDVILKYNLYNMWFQILCVVFGHCLGWRPILHFIPAFHSAELLIEDQMHGG